jgi:hypothetical protein
MMFNDTFNNISVCFRGLGFTNWNIVESVVKHHNPNPLKQTEILLKVSLNIITQTSETNWNIQQYFSLFQRVRVMMFNDTFNNISVCLRGLGLWCLTTLSTIFQFVLESVVKRHNNNTLKQTEILLKVSLNTITLSL